MRLFNLKQNQLTDPSIMLSEFDYYHRYISDETIMVPCGKCDLCIKRKQDDYFIRSYFEWFDCVNARCGSVWFVTLTYEDSILPVLEDGTLCFDSTHIQKFLKRLRRYSKLDFKYLLVSEYGGEYGRPHYHMLLFVDNYPFGENSRFWLLEQIANAWTKKEDRNANMSAMRGLGIFDCQLVDVRSVNDSRYLRYCAKYVGKQFGALEFDARTDIPLENTRRHFQSIGFGDSIFKWCNRDAFDRGIVEVDGYKYAMPQYYKNRLARDFCGKMDDGTLVYMPSDYSLIHAVEVCELQIEECKKLAILNKQMPSLPKFVYEPSQYNRFVECLQNRFIDDEQRGKLMEWTCFLQDLGYFYKDRAEAKAKKYRDRQERAYLKKIGMK